MANDLSLPSRQLVTVFGGSGFVGRHVVRALVQRGYRVRVAVRRPDLAGFLQPLGTVGQIHAVQANLRYPDSVAAAVKGAVAVVNLVGILQEGGRQSFAGVQANGARAVAQACAAAGVTRVVHVSAIGAAAESGSAYARSKAEGEAAVQAAVPSAIVLRPSIVFGPEDGFFNRFAALARMLPVLPLIGGGETRFQPVFVGDVAAVIAKAASSPAAEGVTYELGGPSVYTMREILQLILTETGRDRVLLPLPWFAAGVLGQVGDVMAGVLPIAPPITSDQVEMLKSDNVAGNGLPGLAEAGVVPTSIEAIVPSYLYRYRKGGQYAPTPAGAY